MYKFKTIHPTLMMHTNEVKAIVLKIKDNQPNICVFQ